jgi:hypothetical protein
MLMFTISSEAAVRSRAEHRANASRFSSASLIALATGQSSRPNRSPHPSRKTVQRDAEFFGWPVPDIIPEEELIRRQVSRQRQQQQKRQTGLRRLKRNSTLPSSTTATRAENGAPVVLDLSLDDASPSDDIIVDDFIDPIPHRSQANNRQPELDGEGSATVVEVEPEPEKPIVYKPVVYRYPRDISLTYVILISLRSWILVTHWLDQGTHYSQTLDWLIFILLLASRASSLVDPMWRRKASRS